MLRDNLGSNDRHVDGRGERKAQRAGEADEHGHTEGHGTDEVDAAEEVRLATGEKSPEVEGVNYYFEL